MCGSVACDGGIQGTCFPGETEGSFRKVVCAAPKERSSTTGNVAVENDPTAGVWGGTCTCPDGETYLAGAPRHLRTFEWCRSC
jgi:hypothetical protein